MCLCICISHSGRKKFLIGHTSGRKGKGVRQKEREIKGEVGRQRKKGEREGVGRDDIIANAVRNQCSGILFRW